ncbi:MAG: Esterase EstB [Herbaspirillum frisingense]|uniref:Esterase EstB n=1 Tax=Herbaspirillum frisingense TaxID=92645 RepID=A0A7V8JVH4_9BURK|nr:MAG: Esterase EstB [Herbaspirillum frisingense]
MIFSQLRRMLPAVLGAACIAAGALSPAQAQSQDDALARRVDAQMEQLLGKYPIPGASIAIAYKGEFVYQRGYGLAVTETNTPATPQTRFRIASISKPVTAVAVLKLFEDELPQALDRKVFGPDGLLPDAAYPDFANPRDPRVLKVTLRDLLQHTSGWGATDYDPQYDLADIARTMNVPAPASARNVIAFMLSQRSLDVPPGTEFHYSNFAYNILGRIIEHKTGKPYEQAVQDLVFKPADVDDALVGADRRVQRAANEAVYYDDPRWPPVPDQDGSGATGPESYSSLHFQTMDAHGGWVASAADLVRFVDAAQGMSKTPALLKPTTVALMKHRNPAMPDNNNGLGWVVTKMDGVNILSHSGALTTGTYGYLQAREDGWSWAVLFNRLPIPYPPEKALTDLQAFQTAVQRGLMAAIINKTDPEAGK